MAVTGSGGGVPAQVQATALLAAACRAAELSRPAPRLRDEYAQPLVEAYARLFDSAESSADGRWSAAGLRGLADAGGDEVVARTVLIDQMLERAVQGAVAPLVINLGAGLCARPYRLDLATCELVVEIDSPPVLALKDRILGEDRPSCPVRRVAIDVRDRERLADELATLDATRRRVIVLSEGLLPYLPAEAVAGLARTLFGSLGDAIWLADVVSVGSARGMAQLARRAGVDLDLYGLETPEPLEEAGWGLVDYRILPVIRRGPMPGAGGPPTGGGRPAGPASRRIVDGVLALSRRIPAPRQPG